MEIKSYHVDVKVDQGDDEFGPYGGFTAIISDPSVDRDGEKVMKGAFDPLPEWVPIDINHSRDVLDTVGSASLSYAGDKIVARAEFAATAKAQEIRTLMKGKHIRGVSVMFANAQRGDRGADGAVPILKAELVKFGVVDVPSNRNAQALLVKEATMTTEPPAGTPATTDGDDTPIGEWPTDDLIEALADYDATATARVSALTGLSASEVAGKMSPEQVIALATLADSLGDNAARQAYRAAGANPKEKSTGKAVSSTPNGAGGRPQTYTLDEARAQLRAELDAERRAKMLDVLTDPDTVAAQLGPSGLKRTLYASLVTEMAESIVLARVPDGVDYKDAAIAAQAAVDALLTQDSTTESPAEAPPAESPSDKDADVDVQVLAAARAEVMAQQEQAAALVAQLQGLIHR